MSVTIRSARNADLSVIVKYNQRLAEETEEKSLPAEILTPGVGQLLGDPDKGLYFMAQENDAVIGQLMITREWSDWRNGWIWWIQSVYVEEAARRKGVFRMLYQHVAELARDQDNVVGLRLYVEKENHRAQATYQSMGMDRTDYLVMEEIF